MTNKVTTTHKRAAAAVNVPSSFVYHGVRIRWPQKPTKRTEAICAAARKVTNLGPAKPAAS